MTRTRYVDTLQDFENAVEDYAQRGYDVRSKTERRAICEANDYGSWKMHFLIAIFRVFLGNIPYALFKLITADTVEVKVRP